MHLVHYPCLGAGGWGIQTQVYEEVIFTAGRIIVQRRMHTRGKKRRADYLLSFQKNQPIAVIKAKDNKHNLGDGMQQALTEFPSSDALLDGYCQYKKMPVARTVVEGGLN